uniref:Uncharacterized protein n=1 Tax=Arundo donax TaxID=35708 RepID=A0A0A9H8H3_ARUDO
MKKGILPHFGSNSRDKPPE